MLSNKSDCASISNRDYILYGIKCKLDGIKEDLCLLQDPDSEETNCIIREDKSLKMSFIRTMMIRSMFGRK